MPRAQIYPTKSTPASQSSNIKERPNRAKYKKLNSPGSQNTSPSRNQRYNTHYSHSPLLEKKMERSNNNIWKPQNMLNKLPKELIEHISWHLPTRNIHSLRQTSKWGEVLPRSKWGEVLPRNTTKAATRIAEAWREEKEFRDRLMFLVKLRAAMTGFDEKHVQTLINNELRRRPSRNGKKRYILLLSEQSADFAKWILSQTWADLSVLDYLYGWRPNINRLRDLIHQYNTIWRPT